MDDPVQLHAIIVRLVAETLWHRFVDGCEDLKVCSKVTCIKLVRSMLDDNGKPPEPFRVGLKEAKELVEEAISRYPELRGRFD